MTQVHNFDPGQTNAAIQNVLETYPDKVAYALFEWRKAVLEREKTEAVLHLRFKGEAESKGEKRTADDLKAMVRSSDERYQAVLKEITAEGKYTKLNETLLAAKKTASLRSAF